MGHNIDLSGFGLCSIRCEKCGKDLDLSEIDIDCDLTTHQPMNFDLSLQCYECEHNNEKTFSIKEEK